MRCTAPVLESKARPDAAGTESKSIFIELHSVGSLSVSSLYKPLISRIDPNNSLLPDAIHPHVLEPSASSQRPNSRVAVVSKEIPILLCPWSFFLLGFQICVGSSVRALPWSSRRGLIPRMSRDNPACAPRIHGELLQLCIDIGESSVSKFMVHCRKLLTGRAGRSTIYLSSSLFLLFLCNGGV
jgi:hypothetical protein